MLAMLDGRPLRTGEGLDLVRSAVREHLWPTVGPRNARRAVMTRATTALVLAGLLFVVALSASFTAASGQWRNPVATALTLALDLVVMDPEAALRWMVPFWLVPLLVAAGTLTGLRRLNRQARRLQAVSSTLTAAVAGSVAVLTVQDAWSMNLLGSALPQALVLVIGTGAIGWTTWWIATGPTDSSTAVDVGRERSS
jgi:hypothetical protein